MIVGGIIAEDIPYGIPADTMAGGGLLGNDMQSASGSAIYKQAKVEPAAIICLEPKPPGIKTRLFSFRR